MTPRARRLASAAVSLMIAGVVGCAVQPTHVYDLMDAEGDAAIERALLSASGYLEDRGAGLEVRKAAARTLGRLRHGTPEVIRRLGAVLARESEPSELRAYAAWALGEERSDGALEALVAGLRTRLDATAGEYVLEALAKHYALLATSEDRLVSVVEALVYFEGNQKSRPSAIYDVLSARTRTLPVGVRVLDGASAAARATPGDPRALAAVYAATYELLERIASSRREIGAGGASWHAQVEAAVTSAQGAFLLEEPRTQRLTLLYLGRLGDLRDVALPASAALVGDRGDAPKRPTLSRSAALRLIAAWSLARLELQAPGPRLALARDVLPKEVEGSVLRLLADLSGSKGDLDQLQKILGLDAEVAR